MIVKVSGAAASGKGLEVEVAMMKRSSHAGWWLRRLTEVGKLMRP